QAAGVSPKSLELKLVQLAPLLQDLQSLCAVSQNWASINAAAWSATHEYLFQEPGTKKVKKNHVQITPSRASTVARFSVHHWVRENQITSSTRSGKLHEEPGGQDMD
ncbi:Hypothetical protein SCF082_LOCUS25106, partial [Durusdinium trenchii]